MTREERRRAMTSGTDQKRIAELEAALRAIGEAMESDDDYTGVSAERYRTLARAALAKAGS